ncbi:hypothetical protein MBGDF03_00839, partial [Thermoplasmatales archaeon SCGC AB-540-F20]
AVAAGLTLTLHMILFVANLGIDSWQTFDLNIFMATTSSTGDPLSLDVTFKSVAS